jgi:hypothetical protein
MSSARLAGFVVAALLVLCLPRGAAAAAQAGEVLAMGGQCFVEAAGQRTALKLGDAVHVGDTVDVPAGAKLKLRMSDGSVIAAAPGSRVTIDTYDVKGSDSRDAKLSLASGLLRAVVAATGPQSRFEVDTATGVAAVRSTDWFIEFRPGSTQVGVLSGVVSLTSTATEKSVRIPARWGARVETGRDPVQARVWSDAEFDDVIARTDLDAK